VVADPDLRRALAGQYRDAYLSMTGGQLVGDLLGTDTDLGQLMSSTDHSIELNGDEAHVESYSMFVGTERDAAAPLTVFGGRYVDRFARRDGRWAIAARTCLVDRATSPTSLLPPDLAEADPTLATITRDRTDISYQRPLVPRSAVSRA
jgi:hypothetical protein